MTGYLKAIWNRMCPPAGASKCTSPTDLSNGDVTKDVIRCIELGYRIHVLVGDSVSACLGSSYFKDATSTVTVSFEDSGKGSGYALVVTPGLAIIALERGSLRYGTIAHEVLHVLWRMYRERGISTFLNEVTDEMYAYPLGHLVDEIIDVLEARGLSITTMENLRKKPRFKYMH